MGRRVVHLTSVHPWDDVRVFHKECVSLAGHGYEVWLVAPAPFAERMEGGVRVLGLPKVARWRRPQLWREICRHCERLRPDLAHFHDPELMVALPPLARRLRVPLIYDCHESYPEDIRNKPWIPRLLRGPVAVACDRLERRAAPRVAAIVTADPDVAARFPDHPRVEVVHNFPLGSTIEAADRGARRQGMSRPQVLHLGSIGVELGVWVQLRAAEIVCNRLPDVSFRFVGSFNDPHLGGLARSFCRSRPALDRSVEFVDRLPYDGVLKALAEADIGCIPRLDCAQHRKCIPTKLFEYMCFGLPVVASDLPSIRRYLGGERCGLLVPPGDHRALAAALLRLLGDPTERRRLGERGRRAVRERLNWSSEERSLLRLYDDLLAEGVGPAVPDGSLG